MTEAIEVIEKQALTWPETARAIQIVDQESYSKAALLLVDIASLEKEIIDHHKPIKAAAHAAHKAATAAEKCLLDPLTEAKQIVKRAVGTWEDEQERIRREIERKAQEAARRAEEEARLALAVQAEQAGATEETIAELVEAPLSMPAPVIPMTFDRTKGVTTSKRWSAQLMNLKQLCRAVAEGAVSTELVQPNMIALNAMARAMKSTMNIPGVRAVAETSVAVRR